MTMTKLHHWHYYHPDRNFPVERPSAATGQKPKGKSRNWRNNWPTPGVRIGSYRKKCDRLTTKLFGGPLKKMNTLLKQDKTTFFIENTRNSVFSYTFTLNLEYRTCTYPMNVINPRDLEYSQKWSVRSIVVVFSEKSRKIENRVYLYRSVKISIMLCHYFLSLCRFRVWILWKILMSSILYHQISCHLSYTASIYPQLS